MWPKNPFSIDPSKNQRIRYKCGSNGFQKYVRVFFFLSIYLLQSSFSFCFLFIYCDLPSRKTKESVTEIMNVPRDIPLSSFPRDFFFFLLYDSERP